MGFHFNAFAAMHLNQQVWSTKIGFVRLKKLDVARAMSTFGEDGARKEPSDFDYDLVTIGAGSGGVRAARFAAQYGAKVAVCELPFAPISSDEAGGVGGT